MTVVFKTNNKSTKQQFVRLLTATCND